QLLNQRIREREERLRGFGRALSHEVRNRVGALRGAIDMLDEDFVRNDEAARGRFHRMAVENVMGIERTTTSLIELSRLDTEARHHRNILLPEAAREVARQLRHFAEARRVELRVSEELPPVEIPASAVELAIAN